MTTKQVGLSAEETGAEGRYSEHMRQARAADVSSSRQRSIQETRRRTTVIDTINIGLFGLRYTASIHRPTNVRPIREVVYELIRL